MGQVVFGGLTHFGLRCCVVDSDEDTSDKSADEEHQQHALEELTNLQFKFEVKEVCCWLLPSDQSAPEGGIMLSSSLVNSVMCSGPLGADAAGGPGETSPVLEHLPAGS